MVKNFVRKKVIPPYIIDYDKKQIIINTVQDLEPILMKPCILTYSMTCGYQTKKKRIWKTKITNIIVKGMINNIVNNIVNNAQGEFWFQKLDIPFGFAPFINKYNIKFIKSIKLLKYDEKKSKRYSGEGIKKTVQNIGNTV